MENPRVSQGHEVIELLEQYALRGRRAGMLVRMAARLDTETSELIASSWQLDDQPPGYKFQQFRYPRLVLSQRWLRRADALRALADFLEREQATIPGIGEVRCPQLSLSVRRRPSRHGAATRVSDWPTIEVECTPPRQQEIEQLLQAQQRLIGPRAPLYPSARTAILSFVHDRHVAHDLAAHVPLGISLVCPDRRGRIVGLSLHGDRLTIAAEHAPRSRCAIRLYGVDVPAPNHELCLPLRDGRALINLPGAPGYLLIGLVDSQGNLLDEREIDFRWSFGLHQVTVTPSTREIVVRQWIAGGENGRIEFKQELNTKQDGSKSEFLESVVAFANTDGGTIILGVADHGELVGYQRPNFEDTLVGMLRDKCDPVPRCTVEQIVVDGKPLILVHVAKGAAGRPCSLDRVKVYLRAGATDRLARTDELAEFFRPPAGLLVS